MNQPAAMLAYAGAHLAGLPTLSAEWSLQAGRAPARVRDRVIFWSGPAGGAYERMGQLLAGLNTPHTMRELQARLAPHSMRQGVGLLLAGQRHEVCLYLHHVNPASGAERYDAYKWQQGAALEHSRYEFHFLPGTPAGAAPADLIHPRLVPLYRMLERDPRIRALSGFWLRRRGLRADRAGQDIDQVSLTYPWQPALGAIAGVIDHLLEQGGSCRASLAEHAGQHVRHIALNAANAAAPSVTLYFCGALGHGWPADAADLRARVRHNAGAAHAALERTIFKDLRLPLPGATPAGAAPTDSSAMAQVELAQLHAWIGPGASVYVIGCGWGEVGAYLWRALRCRVTGMTADHAQYRHCAARGQRTRHGSPASTLPPGKFDCILVLSALEEVADRPAFLNILRRFADRIVLASRQGQLSLCEGLA